MNKCLLFCHSKKIWASCKCKTKTLRISRERAGKAHFPLDLLVIGVEENSPNSASKVVFGVDSSSELGREWSAALGVETSAAAAAGGDCRDPVDPERWNLSRINFMLLWITFREKCLGIKNSWLEKGMRSRAYNKQDTNLTQLSRRP